MRIVIPLLFVHPIFEEGVEAHFSPRIQAPHGCEPLGALEYLIRWIEWPDHEDQLGARDGSPHPQGVLNYVNMAVQ